MSHPISDLLNISMKSIKDMIDANTIIGNPVQYNHVTIIPVSRVHLGFLSGGSDIKANNNKIDPLFGGGCGGGLSVSPIAFIVITENEVKSISFDPEDKITEEIISIFEKAIDKTKTLFKNNCEIEKI